MNILAISGSLRKDSYNTALLRAVKALAHADMTIDLVDPKDIEALPLYNQDNEATAYPSKATELKDRIAKADGIIISTPEYNRSIPGALKNMLDWSTRPYGDNPWKGKPVYVLGASIGPIAAALAQYDLKKVLTYFNARVLGQPEFYCGVAQNKFDAEGNLTDDDTKKFIGTALDAFTEFIKAA